jgi:hypothetical protein
LLDKTLRGRVKELKDLAEKADVEEEINFEDKFLR